MRKAIENHADEQVINRLSAFVKTMAEKADKKSLFKELGLNQKSVDSDELQHTGSAPGFFSVKGREVLTSRLQQT